MAQPLAVYIEAFLGMPDWSHQTAINYNSPATATGAALYETAVSIPANGSATASLATLFPAATNVQFISVIDITPTAQTYTAAIGGTAVPIVAGGAMCWTQGGGTPPTLSFTNTNATAGLVSIAVISL